LAGAVWQFGEMRVVHAGHYVGERRGMWLVVEPTRACERHAGAWRNAGGADA